MSLYVALDGPDGCGKSSQAEALVGCLRRQGRAVLHVREPGSTPVGEALRDLLLSPATGELTAVTEVLLFSAARAELVQRVIAPARRRGEIVVAERCFLSTAVYQILAAAEVLPGVLDERWFADLTRRVHGDCLPDAIFVLDCTAEVALRRRGQRTQDRIEARGAAYHSRVREGYLQAAAREPRAHVLDATRAFAAVQADLRRAIEELVA